MKTISIGIYEGGARLLFWIKHQVKPACGQYSTTDWWTVYLADQFLGFVVLQRDEKKLNVKRLQNAYQNRLQKIFLFPCFLLTTADKSAWVLWKNIRFLFTNSNMWRISHVNHMFIMTVNQEMAPDIHWPYNRGSSESSIKQIVQDNVLWKEDK